MNTEVMPKVGDEEIVVNVHRRFGLVSLYDTYLELGRDEEIAEEEGDFAHVENRLDRAASMELNGELNNERKDNLSRAFKAAAKQSVDDLVYLREVVQNVIDETRDLPDEFKEIAIHTYQKDENTIVLDITDRIGMDIARLFNKLLMPFSSSKKDPEKYLGKQGQGFFTLLAGTLYTTIKTVKNGKVKIIKITPVWRQGDIVDFKVEEEESRDAIAGENDGTRFQAVIQSNFPELEATRIRTAVEKFAGLVDEKTLRVRVNDRLVNIPSERRYVTENSDYG